MKRFTDTNKWLDPWFRNLSAPSKMLWFYIVDHCDNIGLCELDLSLVSKDCDIKITESHLEELGERVQRICNGKVYVTKFIPFQYGTLSEDCKPHRKLIEAIRFHGLVPNFKGYQYPVDRVRDRVSDRVSYTLQEKEKEKEKEQEEEKEQEKDRKSGKATEEELREFCKANGLFPRDVEYLWNTWEGNGWRVSNRPIKNWKATIRAWIAQGYLPSQKSPSSSDYWPEPPAPQPPEDDMWQRLLRNKARKEAELRAEEGEPAPDVPWDRGDEPF